MAYRFDDVERGFRAPTLVLIAGWHLKHRWRTGEEVNQAIPQVALAFVFAGDIWNSDVGLAAGTKDEPTSAARSALPTTF